MRKLQAFAVVMSASLAAQSAADPGFFASVEAVLLAPKVQSDGFEYVFYEGVDFEALSVETQGSFDDSLQGGVRLVGGYEGCDGCGVQFRYFHFDQDIAYDGLWIGGTTIPVAGDVGLKAQALDAEVTQRGGLRSWDLVVSGGLRYGSVEYSQPPNFFNGIGAVVFNGATGLDFDGVGPTVALSAQRPMGYGLSIIGRARTALLFGKIDHTPAFLSTPFTIEDEFVQVTEIQFGLGYEREMRCGHDLMLGVFWEAQRWDSDSNFLGDLGLHGLSMLAGIDF